MKCKNCGHNIGKERFCGHCGYKNKTSPRILIFLVSILLIFSIVGGVLILNNVGSKTKLMFQDFTNDEIVYEDGVAFVDSQLIITVDSGYSFDDVRKIVKEYDGKIVGSIEITNDYQVQFDNLGYNELLDLSDTLSIRLGLADVGLHKVYRLENELFTASDSSSMPGDWWRSSIWLHNLEECNYDYANVKVGVFDSVTDLSNKDITYAVKEQWNNPKSLDETTHGTQVSGFISAKINNNIGIDGTSNNSDLYCFAFNGKDECYYNSSNMKYKYALALMLTKGVKIINFSNGFDEMMVGAQIGKQQAKAELDEFAGDLSEFLIKFIDSGYEFIIVKAAGNVCNKTWIEYEPNEDYPFGVKKYNAEEDGELENYTQIETKVFSAEYDVFGAIVDPKVKERIVVVGSARKNGTFYEVCDFSVRGSRIDVFAPGQELTALASSPDDDNPTEDGVSGTSFSAPMVTGVASLVWGANPSLTASEVCECLIDTTEYSVEGEDAGMINAFFAVKHALAFKQLDNSKNSDKSVLMGIVRLKGEDAFAKKAKVSVQKDEEEVDCVETDEYGCFDTLIDSGDYTITITYDGYKVYSESVEVRSGEVCYLDDILLVNENEIGYASGDYLIQVDDKIIYAKNDGIYYRENPTSTENIIASTQKDHASAQNARNLLSDGETVFFTVNPGASDDNFGVYYQQDEVYSVKVNGENLSKLFKTEGDVKLVTCYDDYLFYLNNHDSNYGYSSNQSDYMLNKYNIATGENVEFSNSDLGISNGDSIGDFVSVGTKIYLEAFSSGGSYDDCDIIEFDTKSSKANIVLQNAHIVSPSTNAQQGVVCFETSGDNDWYIYSVNSSGKMTKSEKIPSRLTLKQGVIASDGSYALMMSNMGESDFDLYKVDLKTGDIKIIKDGAGSFKGKGVALCYDEKIREDIYLMGSGYVDKKFNGNGYDDMHTQGDMYAYTLMSWISDGYVIKYLNNEGDFEWCKIESKK